MIVLMRILLIGFNFLVYRVSYIDLDNYFTEKK